MKRPTDEVVFLESGSCTIVGDARYFPLVFSHTYGDINIEAFDAFYKWRGKWTDYAVATGTKVLVIAVTEKMKPPPATIRKHLADVMGRDGSLPGYLGALTVVPNALIRGVVTAVIWVAGRESMGSNFEQSASIPEAITVAKQTFSKAGLTPPNLDPDGYIIPEKK